MRSWHGFGAEAALYQSETSRAVLRQKQEPCMGHHASSSSYSSSFLLIIPILDTGKLKLRGCNDP